METRAQRRGQGHVYLFPRVTPAPTSAFLGTGKGWRHQPGEMKWSEGTVEEHGAVSWEQGATPSPRWGHTGERRSSSRLSGGQSLMTEPRIFPSLMGSTSFFHIKLILIIPNLQHVLVFGAGFCLQQELKKKKEGNAGDGFKMPLTVSWLIPDDLPGL